MTQYLFFLVALSLTFVPSLASAHSFGRRGYAPNPRGRCAGTPNAPLRVRDARTCALVTCLALILGLSTSPTAASAQSLEENVTPLVQTSCLRCHGDRTATPLNLARLGFDLTDRETFKAWEKVYERTEKGEMPPAAAPQPDAAVVTTALGSLKQALVAANLAARGEQRTPLRRLTPLEYAYTIQDLLGIDEVIASRLAPLLPAEADSGGFDTVAAYQSMSPIHVRSYLEAADRALDGALAVGPVPPTDTYVIEYAKSERLRRHANNTGLGQGLVKRLDDAYVAFIDAASTYTVNSYSEGYRVPAPARYRVTVEAYAHQAVSPVTMSLYRGYKPAGGTAALEELIGEFDLVGEGSRTVEIMPYLRPGDLIAPVPADLDGPRPTHAVPGNPHSGYGGMKHHPGEGVALKLMTIEGPLLIDGVWPPESTRQLLTGVEFDADGEIRLTKDPYEHVVDIVEAFAPRAFRRPLNEDEREAEVYASLAKPLLDDGRSFLEAVRVPLRAILSAPPFLFHAAVSDQAGEPGGRFDDFGLATRLSYFLWRSLPDAELLDVAHEGTLSDPDVLARQVERMLDDPKSERFVKDFAGQAFRLYELKATSPDPGLYPEFDDRLGRAMALETELFLNELIAENLGAGLLIDADFTFVNRQLADHYGISGITGEHLRKVMLPADSPRGGLITQASILKITSNGTTTSPIPRGNFVLANLLGQPAPPPPAGVSALEPDTRGTTTIREQLDAHRSSPVCASCHRTIDPPGFALEAFDPIGGFRTNYRKSGGMMDVGGGIEYHAPYREGAPVDATGVTPEGDAFSGIEDYKRLLLQQELDQVARHLASSLLVFSTGAEVEFSDRDAVERIVAEGRNERHPVRTMIHRVVQSDLFGRR